MNASQKLTSMALHSIYAIVMLTVLLGLVYPFVTTKVAQLIFPQQANGSLIQNEQGQIIGSKIIGQSFANTNFFQARPSAVDYNAAASGGSNYGASNPKLTEQINERRAYWLAQRKAVNSPLTPVPLDLLTASGSGLDPHLTVTALVYQAPIVAAKTNISELQLIDLINELAITPIFGSDKYVNVLELNLRVAQMVQPQPTVSTEKNTNDMSSETQEGYSANDQASSQADETSQDKAA